MNKLVTSQQHHIDEIGKYYPEILGKIEKLDNNITRITLGTIIRIMGKDMIWYDIPITYWYDTINETPTDKELFRLYQVFNKEVYIKKYFHIPTKENSVVSRYQIDEKTRLKNEYHSHSPHF